MSLDFSKNYFELFELPVQYGLDDSYLSEQYRKLQGMVHPDRYAGGLEAEQKAAVKNASHVNHAYLTLKDPLLRASYLLKLKYNGENKPQEISKASLRSDFLMEQMELREELELIPEHSQAEEKLETLCDEVGRRRMLLQAYLRDCFDDNSSNIDTKEIAQTIQKLQYFNKLLEEIKALQFEIEDR